MENPSVTLACTQCQRRKVKCDKKSPCGPCSTAKLSCVAVKRPRRPRGRQGTVDGKSAELRATVTRLEALVRSLESSGDSSGLALNARRSHMFSMDVPAEPAVGDTNFGHAPHLSDSEVSLLGQIPFIASSFWTALSDEVVGLRDILDESSDDETDNAKLVFPETEHTSVVDTNTHSPLFSSRPCAMDWMAPTIISDEVSLRLLDVYQDRVDAIFKVGHWPSMRDLLKGHNTSPETKSISALRSAIHFMALCTLSQDECTQYLQLEKELSIHTARRYAEQHLNAANLLSTTDIRVLQAFIVYLAGLRTCESSRASWSLVALAVRIATALGVNTRPALNLNLREREVRKRLWYTIGLLDVQTALDRGSSPLLFNDDFSESPLVTDDSCLIGERHTTLPKTSAFTDMRFCSMTYEAMNLCRRICRIPEASQSQEMDSTEKVRCLQDFKTKFQVQHVAPSSQELVATFTRLVADGIIVTMELLLRRPLYKTYRQTRPTPDNFDVLSVATEVLERAELKVAYTAFQKWQWFSWLKWFALAIVLAELCGRVSMPDVDRAWVAVDACFERYSREIADSASGMLWKPISKLYSRALTGRERAIHCASGGVHHKSVPFCTQSHGGYPSSNVNNKATRLELSHEILKPPLTQTQDDGPSQRRSQACLQTEFLESDQSVTELEAEALSWINWEMFVDDMIETSTYTNQ